MDLSAVTGRTAESGVAHGARLLAFTDAVMGDDEAERARQRGALRAVLPPDAFIDAVATIAAFNVVDRIADATGIPLDAMMQAMSGDIPDQLGLRRFASAANTKS